MTKLDHQTLVPRLRDLQVEIRSALRQHMQTQAIEHMSRAARDDEGDTIFGIDVEVEEMLLRYCERWGGEQHFTLVGEGRSLKPKTLAQRRQQVGQTAR